DRIIQANPQMMAHTLADYVQPDVEADAVIDGAQIDEVLRSILVDTDDNDESMAVGMDGTYQIGLLKGHAVPVEKVRFIGKNARKRYREEQIELITAEIERLGEVKEEIRADIHALEEKV